MRKKTFTTTVHKFSRSIYLDLLKHHAYSAHVTDKLLATREQIDNARRFGIIST